MHSYRLLTSKAVRSLSLTLLATICLLGSAMPAVAETLTTVQNGNWDDPATWDIRVPGTEESDSANVVHDVLVNTSTPETSDLVVGTAAGPGTIDVTSGFLSIFNNGYIGGGTNPGVVNLTGGAIDAFTLDVGVQSAGELNVSGGSLDIGSFLEEFRVGADGFPGTVTVEGGDATFNINGNVNFGADGTLRVRPTGNGAAGLTTVQSTEAQVIDPGSTLIFDDSLYMPQVGDSWEIITFAAKQSFDRFLNIVLPEYLSADLVNPSGESLVLTITEVRITAIATDGLFEDGVRVTWTQPSGLEFINRVYRTDPEIPETVFLSKVAATDTLFFDTTGDPDKIYTYCVERENTLDPGAPIESFCDDGFRKIFAPVQVKASGGIFSDLVRVTWIDRSNIEAGYAIYRGVPGDPDPPLLTTVGPNIQLYDDMTADQGVSYEYTVRAVDDMAFESAGSSDVGIRGFILPPGNVMATDGIFDDKVVITWEDLTEEEFEFRIYRDDVFLATVDADETSYADMTGLGTQHLYEVVSVLELSGPTYVESERVGDEGIGGPQTLAPPSDVSASDSLFDDKVRITWTDDVPNESGFEIRRDGQLIGEVGANATSFEDFDAVAPTSYDYCVTAVADSGGTSVAVCDLGVRSEVVSATNVEATDGEYEDFVRLTWESESTTAVLFKIQQDGAVVKTVAADYRSCDVGQNVPTGQTSTFCVIAVTPLGVEAAPTCDDGFRTLLPPTDVSATDDDFEDRTLITWTDNSQVESGYRILRESVENPMGPEEVGTVAANRTAYIDDQTATAGVVYEYSVATIDGFSDTQSYDSPVATDNGSRKLNPPTNLTASQGEFESKILLTWKDNSFVESSFDIFRDDVFLTNIPADSEEYEDTTVDFGASHDYEVRTVDVNGSSDPAAATGFTRLQPPASVNASDDYIGFVNIVWTDESAVETGYRVTKDGVVIANLPANITSHVDVAGSAGDVAEYCVFTVSGGEVSEAGCDEGRFALDTPAGESFTDRIQPHTQAALGFGENVAVDGDWAMVSGSSGSASVHMFKRDNEGNWTETQVWRGSSALNYGGSIAIDGDFAFIGTEFDNATVSGGGSVAVLKRNGDTWQNHQVVEASNIAVDREFGTAIEVDGDYMVVSAGSGDAYAFERDPSTDLWNERTRIGAGLTLDAVPQIAIDGNTIVLGNPGDDDAGNSAGAVHIFAREDTGWVEKEKLIASNAAATQIFGFRVKIVGNRFIATSLIGIDTATVHVYEFESGSWSETDLITTTDGSVINAELGKDHFLLALTGSGFIKRPVDVYFRDPADGWIQGRRLFSDGPNQNDSFGTDMEIGEDITLIGARIEDKAAFPVATTSAPGLVEASDGEYDNRVRVEWKDQSINEDGFNVYRDGVLITTTGPNTTSYNDFDAIPGRVHTYGVSSVAGNFESTVRTELGWMEPDGTIAGNVSTRAGAAVENVEICLDPNPGRSLLFDGDQGYLLVDKARIPTSAFTIEFWLRAPNLNGTILRWSTPNQTDAIRIYYAGAAFHFVLDGVQRSQFADATGNEWHHVALSWRGNRFADVYLDGQLQGTINWPSTPSFEPEGLLSIGGNPGNINHLGELDEVRVWDRTLDASEIDANYNRRLTGGENGLASYYPMDEAEGVATADLGYNRRNGAFSGGVFWSDSGSPVNVCGLTDIEGNYTIPNLHYSEATTFQVTPSLGERTFEPAFKSITLDEETPVQNEIQFLDITSFALAGFINVDDFEGCLVEGVQILVDGEFAGVTDADGSFTVAAQPGTRVITPELEGRTFEPASRTFEVSADIAAIQFEDTTRRYLRGNVGGGCDLSIGTVTLEITAEDGCLDPIQVQADAAFEIQLPAKSYLVRVADVQNVPSSLDRAAILAFFENLGAVPVDLSTDDVTQNFTYRAPVSIAITGLPDPICDGQTLTDPETGVSFPAVPVIAQGDSVVVTVELFEDYGNGNVCPVDSATVTIFDEIQDIEDEPVTLTVVNGVATYTTRANTPNTNAGRIDQAGNDRSYQKPLTAFAEIPGLDPLQATEWVIVTGSRPRSGTFVTATTEEFPILILRDPPGDASSSFYSQGVTTETVISGNVLESLSGTIENSVKGGIKFDKGTPFFTTETEGVLTTKFGIEIGVEVGVGGELVVTTTTTESFATSAEDVIVGADGDVYLGVGLNLIFAKADDLSIDTGTCTIQRTQSVRFGGDENAFDTVYLFTENHIKGVIIPQLEELAVLEPDSAAVFNSNITNWQNQLTRNQTLKDQAVFVENRSFSAGADFEFETTVARDTTITGTVGIFSESEASVEFDFTESGSGTTNVFGINWTFNATATVTSTESGELTVGYNLSDDDVGDFFSVDIFQDPFYKTPVFKLKSGRSSCPWEPGTQPRDSIVVAVEPRNQIEVPADGMAEFTITLTNESPSGELREYAIVPVTASNPFGAKLNLDGSGFPTERSIFVDAFPNNVQTLTLTVERGPSRYFYEDIKLFVVPPCELANFRNGGPLQFADTLSFSVSFEAPCSDITLFQPRPDWNFNQSTSEATDDTLTVTLSGFEFAISESDSIESVGAEYRRIGTENWFPIGSEIARDDLPVLGNGSPGSVIIPWDVSGIPDGEYEIRAFTRCDQRNFSTTASGRIDRERPEVFGDPQPADLELALGDQISIDFDEPIDCSTVTPTRVTLVVDATDEAVIFDLQCDGDQIILDAADSALDLLEVRPCGPASKAFVTSPGTSSRIRAVGRSKFAGVSSFGPAPTSVARRRSVRRDS